MIRAPLFRKSLRVWCASSVATLVLPFAVRVPSWPHRTVARYRVIELPPLLGQAESGATAFDNRGDIAGLGLHHGRRCGFLVLPESG